MNTYDLETGKITVTNEGYRLHEEGHKWFHEQNALGVVLGEFITALTLPLLLVVILFEAQNPVFRAIAGMLLLFIAISEAAAWLYAIFHKEKSARIKKEAGV